jgi:site-specific recombinase XerD
MTRNDYRYEARRYLRWLEERGLAGPFGPQELEGYHRRPLPEEVRRFLRMLAPIRRPSTVKTYLGFLRRFHEWLALRGTTLGAVDRELCLEWGQHLHVEGIAAATRVGMLVCVRKYIDWLWDVDLASTPGQVLIRPGDLPKKPDYLPRPLAPDADRELQARLEQDRSAPALRLLVMRRAGLRLGELRRLERDCIRRDHAGGRFLKVPLGKMNNERPVPLDPKALEAVQVLQRLTSHDARWLVEGVRAHPVSAATYMRVLAKVATGIALAEPLTSHRLRHTFASSLINGGMSLLGIMKLLGHRDQRMTLRYTAIADATVGREYFEALTRIAERYELPPEGPPAAVDLAPVALLAGPSPGSPAATASAPAGSTTRRGCWPGASKPRRTTSSACASKRRTADWSSAGRPGYPVADKAPERTPTSSGVGPHS